MGGNDIISVGALTALTIYISQFWNPINTLASFYNSLLTAISYLERIFEAMDEPVLILCHQLLLSILPGLHNYPH